MTLSTTTGSLERLQQLYDSGYTDRFVDNALRKIVDRQIARDEADLARLDAELQSFELRFGISTNEFWRQYQSGKLDDTAEFVEWNVFCKMKQRVTERLNILREH
ncbi:MAG: hypothetical protein KDI12_03115 [Anaerolineae bacterium]|nr:hypothetical protein [Anaerolineae bacterium]